MFRTLVKFLLFAVILSTASLFFAQWKLKQELDLFARQVKPFMDFRYDSSTLDYSGEVKIKSISIFVESIGANITIGEFKFFVGNLYQLAFFKSNIKKQMLPKEAYLILKDVLVPFESKLMVQIDKNTPVTSNDVLQTAFCGSVERFGLAEYASMGYSYLAFSSETYYMLDEYNGSVVLNGSFDIEDVYKTEYQMNVAGVLSWVEELTENMMGGDQKGFITPDLSLLEVRMKDQGFHLRKAEYCDKQQDSKTNYYTGHTQEVKKLFEAVDMQMPDEVMALYYDAIQPDSMQSWSIQPTVSFELKNIAEYDYEHFVETSGLKISVNDKAVPLIAEGWTYENFNKLLKFAKVNKEKEKKSEEQYKVITVKQSFQSIRPGAVTNYLNYRAEITRDDNKIFKGKMVKFSSDKVWLMIRNETGEVTLPIRRNRIKHIEVYKPTPQ